MVLYLDDAIDRRTDQIEGSFESMVEAVRVGYITARDQKAHRQYVRNRAEPKRGLTGLALEQAVMRIAAIYPDNVQRITA